MVLEKNGQDQLVPEKFVQDQLVPEKKGQDQLVPEKKGQDQLVPEKLVQDQLVPEKRTPSTVTKMVLEPGGDYFLGNQWQCLHLINSFQLIVI